MIELTPIQRRALKAQAHHLHPVVSISSNGLTAAVMQEIDHALQAHELIKIKVYGAERAIRNQYLSEISDTLRAAPVQQIGNILVIWRQREERESSVKKAAEASATGKTGGATLKSAKAFAQAARLKALAAAKSGPKPRTGPQARPLSRPFASKSRRPPAR